MRRVESRELGHMVRRGFAAALDFLLPRKCVVCESILGPAEMHICSDCLEDLPRTYYWIRKFNPMADKFNALIQKWVEDRLQASKDDCLAASEGSIPPRENYAYATALFFYHTDSGYSNISRQLKYHGDIPAGRCFGRMLGEKIAGAEHFKDVDAVIPIHCTGPANGPEDITRQRFLPAKLPLLWAPRCGQTSLSAAVAPAPRPNSR